MGPCLLTAQVVVRYSATIVAASPRALQIRQLWRQTLFCRTLLTSFPQPIGFILLADRRLPSTWHVTTYATAAYAPLLLRRR